MKSNYYTLILFLLASSALLLTGHLLNPVLSHLQMLFLLWCGWSGTFAIYHVGHLFSNSRTPKELLAKLKGRIGLSVFIFHLIFVLPILCWVYLPAVCFWIFFAVFAFGLLYSYPFKIGSEMRIVKRMLLVKNTFIGFSWAALILVGAAEINLSSNSWWMFLFVAFHILNGSVLRDHYDVEQDRRNGLKTLPIVVGVERSFGLLNVSNLIVYGLFIAFIDGYFGAIVLSAITLYKAILLFGSARQPASRLWTQTLNIGFNYLIFILVLILTHYGIS